MERLLRTSQSARRLIRRAREQINEKARSWTFCPEQPRAHGAIEFFNLNILPYFVRQPRCDSRRCLPPRGKTLLSRTQ